MKQYLWKDDAPCFGLDTNVFFEQYEENIESRESVETLCFECPVRKTCFANGVSGKEWGIWGGVYLEDGEISKEFNKHRTKEDWANVWKSLTME